MYIQPFNMEVDWPEIWHVMEVDTMFYILRFDFLGQTFFSAQICVVSILVMRYSCLKVRQMSLPQNTDVKIVNCTSCSENNKSFHDGLHTPRSTLWQLCLYLICMNWNAERVLMLDCWCKVRYQWQTMLCTNKGMFQGHWLSLIDQSTWHFLITHQALHISWGSK